MARKPARAANGRIAVICVGFLGNPVGLQRLARYFARIDAQLYMHIDAKAEIAPYQALAATMPNVTLVADRVPIWWGGFSLVRAMVVALRQAIAEAAYVRFCLITEDSAPLVTAEVFYAQMMEPCEYMQLHRGNGAGERYDNFYFLDCAATNPRSVPEARVVAEPVVAELHRLERLREDGKLPIARMFHGPTWWALTGRAINEILLHYDNSPHMRESFEFSLIPEEQYFHTILGNATRRFAFRPFMFADFSRVPSPYTYSTLAELRAARSLPYLFIRKVYLPSTQVAEYFEMLEA